MKKRLLLFLTAVIIFSGCIENNFNKESFEYKKIDFKQIEMDYPDFFEKEPGAVGIELLGEGCRTLIEIIPSREFFTMLIESDKDAYGEKYEKMFNIQHQNENKIIVEDISFGPYTKLAHLMLACPNENDEETYQIIVTCILDTPNYNPDVTISELLTGINRTRINENKVKAFERMISSSKCKNR